VRLRCECTYCGHAFFEFVFDQSGAEGLFCPKCKDTKLKYISDELTDPFGYLGFKREDNYLKPKKH
jgi:hypothetical protein